MNFGVNVPVDPDERDSVRECFDELMLFLLVCFKNIEPGMITTLVAALFSA